MRTPAVSRQPMVLVAGSANLDFVVRAQHIPAPGETVLGRDFKTFPGGKGANQAVACARAGGATTHMLLGLGDDAYAATLEHSLRAADVALHIVRAQDQPTGTAFICVSDDAENAITVAPGANHALRPDHWPSLAGLSHLLLQLEIPLDSVTAYARAARAQGSIAQQLRRLPVPCVIVTLGSHGCLAFSDRVPVFQTALAVTPVDTTGAGDTFCGAFTAALGQQSALGGALRLASAAAALACTRMGAQSSIPQRSEVDAFLAQQPRNDSSRQSALRAFCGFAD